MGKKICPICDGPLGIGDFCGTCKRRIKNPIIISSEMHLNEHHSQNEVNCEFHAKPIQAAKTAVAEKRTVEVSPSSTTKSGKVIGMPQFVVIVVALIISAGGAIGMFVADNVLSYVAVGQNLEKPAPEEVRTETLTLEEARAFGTRCNALNHFPVSKEASLEFLESWCTEYGFGLSYESNNVHNQIDYYGDETYYLFLDIEYMEIGVGDEAGTYYLDLSSDSVTGEIHSLSAVVEKEETAKQLMIDFGTFLESLPGISEGENGLADEINELEINTNGEFVNRDYGYFSVYKVDQGYSVYINSIE